MFDFVFLYSLHRLNCCSLVRLPYKRSTLHSHVFNKHYIGTGKELSTPLTNTDYSLLLHCDRWGEASHTAVESPLEGDTTDPPKCEEREK